MRVSDRIAESSPCQGGEAVDRAIDVLAGRAGVDRQSRSTVLPRTGVLT